MKGFVTLLTALFHGTVAVICHIINVTFRFISSLLKENVGQRRERECVHVGRCMNVCTSGTFQCHRKSGRVTWKRGPHPGNGPSDRSPSIFIAQRCSPTRTRFRTGERLRTGSRLFSTRVLSTNFTSQKARLFLLSRLVSTFRTIITTRSLLLM